MHVIYLLTRNLPAKHSGSIRPSLPEMILPILLRAAVLLQFPCPAFIDHSELDLLSSVLEEYLRDIPVYPLFLFTPHQVNVVWHNDKSIEPYAVVYNHEFQTFHDYVLPDIRF